MKYNTLDPEDSTNARDCLSVSLLGKKKLPNLFHYHDEYELSLICNADRVKLSVGNEEYCLNGTNLLLTALQMFGIEKESIGDSTKALSLS